MDRVLKTCLSPALDDNYLSKNNASTQVLYLNKRILSDFFQNDNLNNTLGEIVSRAGKSQIRIASC